MTSAALAPRTRLLVVGLDSADPQLLTRFADAGDLPVLRSLRDRGLWGPLRSPPGLADDATWASFITGVSPARHGRFFFHAVEPGAYATPFWQSQHLKHPPFWEALSDAGHRIAVVDVPKCPLSDRINGVHITDWRVHGRDRATASQPAELAAQLIARFGKDVTDSPAKQPWPCDQYAMPEQDYAGFLASLVQSADDKLRVTTELLEQAHWDLFMVVFKEAHCVGHKFFHLLERSNPRYSASQAARYGNAIREIYQHLDRALGKLLQTAGADANIIVFSDLGMASNYTGNFLLDEILQRLERGWLSPGGRVRQQSRRLVHGVLRRGRGDREPFERRFRSFYPLQNGEQSGAIRLNIRGREPDGMVSPGAEYDALCDYLVTALRGLVDPDSGMPIVDEVLRSGKIYQGPHRERLPDLLVMWNRSRPIHAAASDLIGVIRHPDPGIRTGGHIADGMYVLAGPDIRYQSDALPASIMDIAPTVAQLLHASLPDVDGRPISSSVLTLDEGSCATPWSERGREG